MIIFSRLVETLQKALSILEKIFPETTFWILEIDGILLKITNDISVNELKEQYDQRIALHLEGEHRALKKYYRREGLL
jgi:hypothetical protein